MRLLAAAQLSYRHLCGSRDRKGALAEEHDFSSVSRFLPSSVQTPDLQIAQAVGELSTSPAALLARKEAERSHRIAQSGLALVMEWSRVPG